MSEAKAILCVMKKPKEAARLGYINNSLEAMQAYVGGLIETCTFAPDATIVCNEEGRLLGLERNVRFCGADFVGPILVVGIKGDGFCSLSRENAEHLVKWLGGTV